MVYATVFKSAKKDAADASAPSSPVKVDGAEVEVESPTKATGGKQPKKGPVIGPATSADNFFEKMKAKEKQRVCFCCELLLSCILVLQLNINNARINVNRCKRSKLLTLASNLRTHKCHFFSGSFLYPL